MDPILVIILERTPVKRTRRFHRILSILSTSNSSGGRFNRRNICSDVASVFTPVAIRAVRLQSQITAFVSGKPSSFHILGKMIAVGPFTTPTQ